MIYGALGDIEEYRGMLKGLADDKFALFVAGEPHMPTLEFPGDGAQPVKKICFKLLADAYWEE